MPNQTLLDDFRALSMTNNEYGRNRDRWNFLYQSYIGGEEYRRGYHLTRYALETDGEYRQRLVTTPLDNHCASVISTYISFLFRECAEREFADWEMFDDVKQFLDDCDYEGRSFDAFMKDVATWASVFGHCWIMMTKPNIGAATLGQEMDMGIRPYVNLMTPLVVSDWRWERRPTGAYELVYIKYVEEVVDKITIVREWTPETIKTWHMDTQAQEAWLEVEEVNGLGMIPAVLVYNRRSVVKGIGVSDISDIADIQKLIYNMTSENEQSIRLDGHPSLVVPPTAQLGSGAGALIQLQEGSDPGLNPYYLEHSSAGVNNIHSSVDKLIASIDRMAHTGGVRGTQRFELSGIAMETEFQLLNAKLSEKADNLELAEEQLWKLFGIYQGREWNGEVEYPDSFHIRDEMKKIEKLVAAKSAATDPRVLEFIDHEIIEALGEDADLIMPEMVTLADGSEVPYDSAEPFDEPEEMFNPVTGEVGWVITFADKREAMLNGWIEKE
jgi:hypothetical protein